MRIDNLEFAKDNNFPQSNFAAISNLNYEVSYKLFKAIHDLLNEYPTVNRAIIIHASYAKAITITGLGFKIASPKTIWKNKIAHQINLGKLPAC